MFLRVYSDSAVVRLELAVTDVVRALALPWDPKARPTPDQVRASLAAIRSYVEPRFALGAGAERAAPVYRSFDFRGTETGEFLLLEYVIDKPLGTRVPITLTPFFELAEATRRNLVVIQHNWRTGTFNNDGNVSLILSPQEPTQELDLSDSSVWRGFVALVRLGVWHIWIGIDHILFLIALILPSVLRREGGRWRPRGRLRPRVHQDRDDRLVLHDRPHDHALARGVRRPWISRRGWWSRSSPCRSPSPRCTTCGPSRR